jgi:pimeloyl-ACP methyl ester carboxylesterase
MLFTFSKKIITLAIIGAAVFPSACSVGEEVREVTAERVARPAFMVERFTDTGGMHFALWERMHERGQPANVYIEGDGDPTYINRDVTVEPTPENPVALHLASRDLAKNVVHIARPCHYMESPDPEKCDPKFWSTRRFSPEVFKAYNDILDDIRARYDITEFNVIGYDGGANIAAVLASQRSDIVSLRTVAGNLNPDMVYAKPPQALDADNLKAIDVAKQLSRLPQHHFVGAGDELVPAGVYHSYMQAMGPSECVHYTFVPDADHERGWVERWPEFLKSTLSCPPEAAVEPTPFPPAPDYNPNK